MIQRQCKECGKEFNTYPSVLAQGRGKYCSKTCSNPNTLIKQGQRISQATEIQKGAIPYNYQGYRFTQSRPQSGIYKLVHAPNHPYATKAGYVREHRLVMEAQLKRYLRPDEVVDHINMDTLDNRPENLRLMAKREHDYMNTPLNIHRRWQRD